MTRLRALAVVILGLVVVPLLSPGAVAQAANRSDLYQEGIQAAACVVKILQGAKSHALPVEGPGSSSSLSTRRRLAPWASRCPPSCSSAPTESSSDVLSRT